MVVFKTGTTETQARNIVRLLNADDLLLAYARARDEYNPIAYEFDGFDELEVLDAEIIKRLGVYDDIKARLKD